MSRHPAHGSDIADRAAERFPPDTARIVGSKKVHTFDDGIGFQKLPPGIPNAADNGTIVARGSEHMTPSMKTFCEQGDKAILAQIREREGARGSPLSNGFHGFEGSCACV